MLWWIIAILGIVLLLLVICFGVIFICLQNCTGLENIRAAFVFAIIFFVWIIDIFFTDTLPKLLLWPFQKIYMLYEKTKRK